MMNEMVTKLKEETVNVKTIRHTFTENVVEKLKYFSNLHQNDKSKEYRESWKKWINNEEIKEILNKEVVRLSDAGMSGDIMDRMYKSSRHYYRKKSKVEEKVDNKQKERKKYEGLSRVVLRNMDEHLVCMIRKNIKDGTVIVSPQKLFEEYILDNKNEIDEISFTTTDDVMNKIKKTFKNRFYNMKVKILKNESKNTEQKMKE